MDGPCHPEGYATWAILLLPFMEQTNLWDLVDTRSPLHQEGGDQSDHERVRKISVPTYFTPNRRSPPQLTADDAGSTGDYACVTYALGNQTGNVSAPVTVKRDQPRTFDGAMLVCRAFNPTDKPNTGIINGMAPGTLGPGDWRSMTNFASVLDGLSNTVFIGEKAVRKDTMGVARVEGSYQDGTLYYGVGKTSESYTEPGVMAYWSRRLAEAEEGVPILCGDMNDDPDNRFGGWSPGVTLFVLGDGSVRTVPNETSNVVLQRLGTRNDRLPVDLR
jgi:hypothetical protein